MLQTISTQQPQEPETLTLFEVSDILRLSHTSVGVMLRRGEIPGRKIGKFWRIPRAQFYAWLVEGAGNTTDHI